jgi:preflagellin peptidase FlaK
MIIENISTLAMLLLGIYASVSDIRKGIIKNKVLIIAASYAALADIVYYGFLRRDLAALFLINIAIVIVIALILFFSHSWAGGDCKLVCVFCLLYPASKFLTYNNQAVTLIFSVVAAFVICYIYLVVDYIRAALHKCIHFSVEYVKNSMLTFAKSYMQTLIYLTSVHMIYIIALAKITELSTVGWITIDFCVAWLVSSVKLLHNKYLCGIMFAVDVVLSVYLHMIPLSTNILRYLFVWGVVLMRIILSEHNYQTISTEQVCRGMILSTPTSMQFMPSRVKGLPGISTEDLRSRLTEEEADSIKRWEHSATGRPQIIIVRKIPFAIFISLGFLIYYIVWRVV